MRYFLHIAYNGKKYSGWQRQKDALGIQEVVETSLTKVLGRPTTCVGCGRTDAGVHASQYVLHFDLPQAIDFDAVFRFNKVLPDDIVVFDVLPMDEKAHAQYDATKRTYDYFLHFTDDPFLNPLSTLYTEGDLAVDQMKAAVDLLVGEHDFRMFCKRPDIYKHTLCKVSATQLHLNKKQNRLHFQITSNRFVRGMIRLLVGNLLKLGEGKITLEEFESYLNNEKKPPFFNLAYPQGLYLSKIEYPYLNVEMKSELFGLLKKEF